MELQRYESFGEFEDAVVDVDLKVRLLGPRDGKWRLGHADVDGITVQQGVETVPNLCEASGWPTHLMFLLSPGTPGPTWLNGVPFGPGKVGILAPRRGFVFRAAGPNEWTTIALPLTSDLLQKDNETGSVLRAWCRSTRMLDATPAAVRALQQAATVAAHACTSPTIGRALIEDAIAGLVVARSRQPALGRPGASPHAMCDAALSRFGLMDGGELDAARLAGLPVGPRSLRSFFHNCFGLGPKQYLHLRRLHAIHQALQDMGEGLASIAETFERHGYVYSSYTLARYCAIFGELPSATRARQAKA
ncbi:hypothetical protein A6B37_23535 [Achromobacter sp. HZ01]|uniref:helix-turn-helix domain-containing protein n=1 Tax=Achromobacter sp. HZ01 TaxID=1416886 RepID=UPI000DC45D7E|nr:helix-turn-helix domain-containing protein [Achromobacter sp. HZ01]RAP60459.1 hypothetical protein A6B37_23535 [Achromobacter sp. HZ01]